MLEVNSIRTAVCISEALSLHIQSGEQVALVGPNGAGKSTLIRAMVGQAPPEAGHVSLLGRSIYTEKPRWVAQHLAVVHQHEERPTGFTVEQLVAMGRYPHESTFSGTDKAGQVAIDKALESVDLHHARQRIASSLSGGEYQRMRIARAIAQEPEILVLDEPLAHLDIGHAHDIASLLKRLNENQGITIFAAIHDLNIAALYFDRVVLMHNGKIHADGSIHDVMTNSTLEAAFNVPFEVQEHPRFNRPQFFAIPR